MNIIVLNGHPKPGGSPTTVILNHLLEGCRESGAGILDYNLGDMKIESCIGCLYCWTNIEGRCILEDDASLLSKEFQKSEVAIFASPLKFFSCSSLLKIILERLFMPYTSGKRCLFVGDEYYYVTRRKFSGERKKILFLLDSEFSDTDLFAPLIQSVKSSFSIVLDDDGENVMDYMGSITIGCSVLAGNADIFSKCTNLKGLLKRAGKQIVQNSNIEPDLFDEINLPLYRHAGISREEAFSLTNRLMRSFSFSPGRGEKI
ncbi:MAG: flavodoxin family protein [Oligoflexales bacterium]|nr:flavodoxin family protein [Oligoflexales bacterium]